MIPQTLIPAFVEDARCAESDPEIFFPGNADWRVPNTQWSYPRAVCSRCPVKAACLTAALEAEADGAASARFGMFGGLSPAERAKLVGQRIRREPAKHGTDSGYHMHRRRSEEACDACRDAHAQAQRERHARAGTA